MDTLIIFAFFTFASQILHIFGELTVLQEPEYKENKELKRKLLCLSEDDDDRALVWNYNLYWNYYSAENNNYTFRDINKFSNQEIDCKMNANEDCLKKWTKNDWSLTNSLKTPMGPVFDRRWEEFKQYENLQDTYDHVDFELPTKVKLMFSVRTSHDAQILICNGRNYDRALCYWIIIGGWGNTLSVIRKCTTGVPQPGKWTSPDCEKALVRYSDNWGLLSGNHWQIFGISWDSTTRNITVYEQNRIMMHYEDEENSDFSDSHMFIRSDTAMLLRFHIYDFFHTTKQDAVLTSPIFHFNNETICIQMFVGLCAECSADVVLRNYVTNEELETVTVKSDRSAITDRDIPLWEFVKITKKFLATDYNNYNAMIIQLIPKLFKNSTNPLWAIANVRQCSGANAVRMGTMISKQDWKRGVGYFWPTENCQKIFRGAIDSSSEIDINLDGTNCPEGKIGPQCILSCLDLDCGKIKICNRLGCTCASGFSGDTCSIPCKSNKYGFGCRRTCGSCLNNERCNKVTGECTNGCDNDNERIYISPLCQISVDDAPSLSSNETTILANVSVIWKDEYEEISILYSFVIYRLSYQGQIKNGQQTWNKLFRNMTQLTTYFENLEPGTLYNISLALNFNGGQVINGDWEIIETDCIPVEYFDITPEEKGIIIDWRDISKHSCPPNWYYLIVHNIGTSEEVVSTLVKSRPYKLNLPSYTSFNITIFHNIFHVYGIHLLKLFSQKIHTLEGVPSRVLDLENKLSANTEITLIWKPPYYPNGEIVRYEVILKVKEYYGCTNLRLPTPDNHTIKKFTTERMITITDLHPFASYSAQVVAHNSRHFSMAAETTFNTGESEIPSEIFNQLRVENWTLLWNPPEDCTTITGSLKARIKIRNISDNVKYFNVIKQTRFYSYDLSQLNPKLNGVERYEATIYVIRDYNAKENTSAYQKYEFETPPTAPPNVTNLEIVEIDNRQTPAMLHLRWQSPLPPLNGKLRDYSIQICDKLCSVFEVPINESCKLWDDYVCKVIRKPSTPSATIKVFAYNVNVTEPGLPVIVTDEMLGSTTLDSPGNYTYIINNNSVVDLKWLHPWRTGSHLKSFHIRINETFSNLRSRIFQSSVNEILEYPVTQYMRNYTKRLYLFPSTHYIIYIEAVTANTTSNSKFVEIYTPSTAAFDGVLDVTVNMSDSTILLSIPSVLNDTRDSTMHIIVKGLNLCEKYSEVPENLRAQAGINVYEMIWQAAEVLTSELAGEQFKIGDNKTYGNAKNCPLKLEEFYEIMVIVTERNSSTKPIILTKSVRFGEVTSKHYEVYIIPIMIFLALVGATFCLCRRKRQNQQLMQDEIDLSQKLTELLKQEDILSQNIQDKQETEYVNLKQALSASDKYFLFPTASELMPVAVKNNKEKEIE